MTLPHLHPSPIVYPDAEPGVYRCGRKVAGRWPYMVLGTGGVLLEARRGRIGETDAEVVSDLRTLYLAAVRAPLRLISPSGALPDSHSPVASLPPRPLDLAPPR